MINKTSAGVLVLILIVLAGGYYFWTRPVAEDSMNTDSETGVSGRVIESEGQVDETADLEAELNASDADTEADMAQLEAELEAE